MIYLCLRFVTASTTGFVLNRNNHLHGQSGNCFNRASGTRFIGILVFTIILIDDGQVSQLSGGYNLTRDDKHKFVDWANLRFSSHPASENLAERYVRQ
jgi:hypothetical protein